MVKKRGIAKKPTEKTADDWVSSGGIDPEMSIAEQTTQPESKAIRSLPKSRDPNYSQIGLYLPTALHKRMKIGAAITELEISDIAAQAISEWLDKQGINS